MNQHSNINQYTLSIQRMYKQPSQPVTPERRKKLRASLSDYTQSDSTKRYERADLESMTDDMGYALQQQFAEKGDFDDGYIPWLHMTDKYTAANMNMSNLTPASSVIRGVPIRFLRDIQADTALLTTSSMPRVRVVNYKKPKYVWISYHPSLTNTKDIPNKAFINAFILPVGTDESRFIKGAEIYASGTGEYAVVKVSLSVLLSLGGELYMDDHTTSGTNAWIIVVNKGTLIPVNIVLRGS